MRLFLANKECHFRDERPPFSGRKEVSFFLRSDHPFLRKRSVIPLRRKKEAREERRKRYTKEQEVRRINFHSALRWRSGSFPAANCLHASI
jgi:hypothetical protein